ncbi:MAG TPA: NAD(P)-dependent oxidoreductase [Candidatus Dormibacteraeota bacterium]|nr:NAD(P)-dependent oxidoreductase [Candidatus Dormibacteraeota bacterium]
MGVEELLTRSDLISLNVDLNECSWGMAGAAQLQFMNPTVFLVNSSRDLMMGEPALSEALRQGPGFRGTSMDVFAKESPVRAIFENGDVMGTWRWRSSWPTPPEENLERSNRLAADNVLARMWRSLRPVGGAQPGDLGSPARLLTL